MKLTDIIYNLSSYYRGIANFLNHPLEILSQQGRRIAQDKLEQIEVPVRQRNSCAQAPEQQQEREGRSPALPLTPRPLPNPGRLIPLQETQTEPLLSEQNDIRGRWGRYRRVGEVIQSTERVRWYDGVLVLNNRPVVIKQYLLPDRVFSPQEIRERKEKFAFLSNLNLRNGGGQDFRLVNWYEAIAPTNSQENCCYLISEPIPESQTLRAYLSTRQALDALEVRQILNQVLQTLWFLHHQKLRLPDGEIQYSLPHGNLHLDSLLISPAPAGGATAESELQFFIHVTDLALWEHLFLPGTRKPATPTIAQDLVDLGYIGFSLLTGHVETHPRPNLLLEQPWVTVADQPLKRFIQQLVRGEFSSAEEARQALFNLPPQPPAEVATLLPSSGSPIANSHTQKLRQLLVLALLGGCLGGLLWLGWRWIMRSQAPNSTTVRPCCLNQVPLPATPTTYVTEAGGIWNAILRAQNLVAFDQSLEQALKQRDPRLSNYRLQTVNRDAVAVVQTGQAEFALTEWRDNLPEGLQQQEIAYDGLAIVVAFGDAERSQSIPQALQGKISSEQLRQLYTGSIQGWEPPENLKSWKVQLYRPEDSEAIALFERTVLQTPDAITRFRKSGTIALPANRQWSSNG